VPIPMWRPVGVIALVFAVTACGGPEAPPASTSAAVTSAPSDETGPAPSNAVLPLAGCGTGEAAFRTAAAAVDRTLLFGGRPVALTTAGMQMRDGSVVADDAIPGFLGLSPRSERIRAAPRVSVTLAPQAAMRLTAVQAGVYQWGRFDFSGDLPNANQSPKGTLALLDGIGGASVTVPEQPGEYAIEFTVNWLTECLSGDGVAYARVVVR
jgi:hypothetical protein